MTPEREGPPVGLRVDVLGPLRLTVDGTEVEVPGPRRRAVLAMLVLSAGRTVSVDALLDAIWPETTPDSGRRALHSHVSRLRGHLGPHASALERDGNGYRLRAGVVAVDVDEVRAAVAEARAARPEDPGGAARQLGEALTRWRGPALEEFAEVAPLAADAVALASLRADLVDEWLDARHAAGGDGDLHRDAARAVADAPLRERTASILIRALAADGRQSEAMREAHEFRRRLADETGFDPTPAFTALEHEVASGTATRPVPPPPPRTEPTPRRRRGRPSTPLIGRDRELAHVMRIVESTPLVTVVGPGGVGKTRLVLEAAAEISDASERDVHVVELATIEDGRHTLDALGVALGLRAPEPDSLRTAAHAVLSSGRPVLVVDNCEHLVASCRDLIGELLAESPGLTVLTTSREPLDLPEEHLVRLGPLPVPEEGATFDDVETAPAVEAFVAHVRRRDQTFALTTATAPLAAEVARRLDGLPLALELAAGRVATLGIEDVQERLTRALDLLGSGRTSADARHRTLRSTIDWSYRLLDEHERALLRALSVFPAGLDLNGVERLADHRDLRGDPAAVIARLVDASVVVAETTVRRNRFRLLETVRAYALEDANARGEREQLDRCLVDTVLDVVADLAELSQGPREVEANAWLAAEFPNIRAARDVAARRGDIDAIARLSIELHDLGVYRAYAEAQAWAIDAGERVRAALDRSDAPLVLGAAARAAWLRGELDRSIEFGTLALERATNDREREPGYDALGIVALFQGDFARCEELLLRAAATPGTKTGGAYFVTAALGATYAGDDERAAALLRRAIDECDRTGSISDLAFARYGEGELLARHDLDAAIAAYEDAVALARTVGASFTEGVATVGLASAWGRLGRLSEALGAYRWLVDYWRRAGNWTLMWTTLRNLALALLDADDPQCAAFVLAAAAHAEGAASLTPETEAEHERLLAVIRDRLGADEMARVQARARALPRGRVVDEALEAVDLALR